MTTNNIGNKEDFLRSRLQESKSAQNLIARVPQLPLPPVRAQQLKSKAARRKMLLKNGFNESIGRATPRCLRNEQPVGPASSTVFGASNNNIGAFQGTSKGQETSFPHLTDAKSIMDTVEDLRRGQYPAASISLCGILNLLQYYYRIEVELLSSALRLVAHESFCCFLYFLFQSISRYC
jgi:hypothetical protein